MATLTFKRGSTPHKLHEHFVSGKSLTYDEAYAMGIRHLTQRVADLKKKFEEAGVQSPLMVIDESNKRGGTHARYFYHGCGSLYQTIQGARDY